MPQPRTIADGEKTYGTRHEKLPFSSCNCSKYNNEARFHSIGDTLKMKKFLLSLLALLCSVTGGAVQPALALEVGDTAPAFTLTATDGSKVSLEDLKGKTVVLEWFNAGCPFVKKHYRSGEIQKLQSQYAEKGVVWLMMNSTKSDHRDYLSPEAATAFLTENKVQGAKMLLDTAGTTGKAYGARTTPHLFVINGVGTVVYQGAIDDDDSTDGDPATAQNYVRAALDSTMSGSPVALAKTNPYGCSIKYAS